MRIEELTLWAPDVAAQAEFYGRTLGLPVERDGDAVAVTAGASRLVFRAAPGPLPAPYHFAFNVAAGGLPAAKEWLRSRGVATVASADGTDEFAFDDWQARAVYFEDAAGNLLELIARREFGDGGAAGPTPVRSVSEVGVAVADVPATCAELTAAVAGSTLYRQEVNGSFVALGNAEGLFIVVREGRVWFPTADRAAAPLPTRVRVSGGSQARAVTLAFGGASDDGALPEGKF